MNVEELENESVPENMTAVLKAFSDPNRLRIFAALLRGVSCNGWLTEELGLPANLLSHHLKVLREAGLVQDRRDAVDGRWIYYQVDVSTLTSIHQWLGDFLNPTRVALQPHLCGPEATTSDNNNLAANFVLEAVAA